MSCKDGFVPTSTKSEVKNESSISHEYGGPMEKERPDNHGNQNCQDAGADAKFAGDAAHSASANEMPEKHAVSGSPKGKEDDNETTEGHTQEMRQDNIPDHSKIECAGTEGTEISAAQSTWHQTAFGEGSNPEGECYSTLTCI